MATQSEQTHRERFLAQLEAFQAELDAAAAKLNRLSGAAPRLVHSGMGQRTYRPRPALSVIIGGKESV